MDVIKKKFCKLTKNGWTGNEDAIRSEVLHPEYICRKCLRVAVNKKILCDPQALKK